MLGMEAEVRFDKARRQCGRMWHAMRLARLNLTELTARRWVSRIDLAEAYAMIKTTRQLYYEALDELYACERALRKSGC